MITDKELAALRREYTRGELSEESVSPDPIRQFGLWFKEALDSLVLEPHAMTLATSGKTGAPNARTVLLKGFDEKGFVFCTNYESEKGRQLLENPQAELLFYWKEMERQVRINGHVKKTTDEESYEYFNSRPVESRLGAWASNQSTIIQNRQELIDKFEYYRKQFEGSEIPVPPHWGGFRVIPSSLEFWQGRANRLHDRIRYIREDAVWKINRLSP